MTGGNGDGSGSVMAGAIKKNHINQKNQSSDIHRRKPINHCSLFIIHYSLFIIHCSLFIIHCSLKKGDNADAPTK
jgi:hypothetical protein